MTFVWKIVRRLAAYRARLQRAYHFRRFVWWEGPSLRYLRIGPRTRALVPLRSGGAGRLVVGDGNSFGYGAAPVMGTGEILLQPRHPAAEIRIGDGNLFSNNVTIVANERIEIGDGCQIGDQVAIYDCDFHEIAPATRNRSCGPTRPVSIGNNVWLGSRVIVLKGVSIGENSVVAAMSVVTVSIPPNSIAAGVPARVVRTI